MFLNARCLRLWVGLVGLLIPVLGAAQTQSLHDQDLVGSRHLNEVCSRRAAYEAAV